MSDSPNFLTYAQTAFDSFGERPFCAVDSLVFAWLSYLRLPDDMAELTNWQGLDARELLRAECYRDMIGDLWDPEGSRALLEAVAASPRYRGVNVCGYRAVSDVVATEQFAAMTFRFPAGFSYLSFRGTDSTIVGWKEDFNMAFRYPVPAQESAARYVDEAADAIDGPLLCGGHSKGGNLAVYGAAMCSDAARERIERAYSHDGPGFVEEFLSGNAFASLSGRIDKTLPQSSIFGMMFETQEDYAIVESTEFSLLQHNPFSWVVDGCDFVYCERLSAGARYVDGSIREMLLAVSPGERERFVDALFSVFEATGAERFADIAGNLRESLPVMLQAAQGLTRIRAVLSRRPSWQSLNAHCCPNDLRSTRPLPARVWQNSSRLGSPSSCASHWCKATCPRCVNLRCTWGWLDRYTGSCRNRSRTECRI